MSNFQTPPAVPGYNPPTPAPSSQPSNKVIAFWLIVGIVLFLFVVALATEDETEPAPGAAASAGITAPAVVETTEAPATTRVAVTEAPPTMADRIDAWYDDYGTYLDDIEANMTSLEGAASLADLDALEQGCRDLGINIERAQGLPPMPLPIANDHWQEALDDYASGATACAEGAANFDSGQLDLAATFIRSGTDNLDRALDAVQGAY